MTPRQEYECDALLDADEQLAWERSRSIDLGLERGTVSTRRMVRHWAGDRAQVEAQAPTGEQWRRLNMEAAERDRLRWVGVQLALDREAEREAEDAA